MRQEITPNHTIAQVFELAPDSVTILENAGLKVTGCDARTDRTLEQLFAHNDVTSDKEAKVLEHLNKLKQVDQDLQKPTKADQKVEKIIEGNKTYYKLAGLLFTNAAYNNLHQIADKKGLRIRLEAGGCSGFKYEYDFHNEPSEDEKIYPLSDELAIYMNDFTFAKSHGSIVEFKLGLHESGLSIVNPNKKRACSCGTSIAF